MFLGRNHVNRQLTDMYYVLHHKAKCLHIGLDYASTRITLFVFARGHSIITQEIGDYAAIMKESNTYSKFFFFWPHHAACGILIPRPGMEPVPPAVGAWSPKHWTAREFPTVNS